MSKKESKNLGFLGYSFQVKLARQVMEDTKFSESIIEILDPQYFDNEYLRLLVASVKDYHEKYETIPTYDTLQQVVNKDIKREIARESAIAMIKEIQGSDDKDCIHIQDTAVQFCKQQELKKATQKIQKILESGDFDRYRYC